jgi:hypothetical protein
MSSTAPLARLAIRQLSIGQKGGIASVEVRVRLRAHAQLHDVTKSGAIGARVGRRVSDSNRDTKLGFCVSRDIPDSASVLSSTDGPPAS